MQIETGARLHSVVCSTEVIVVKAPSGPGTLSCGGAEMAAGPGDPAGPSGAGPTAGRDTGTVLGKRYVDEESGLEALCAKAGPGSLAFEGRALTLRSAKPLPASD